jgi:hypothetical protein
LKVTLSYPGDASVPKDASLEQPWKVRRSCRQPTAQQRPVTLCPCSRKLHISHFQGCWREGMIYITYFFSDLYTLINKVTGYEINKRNTVSV